MPRIFCDRIPGMKIVALMLVFCASAVSQSTTIKILPPAGALPEQLKALVEQAREMKRSAAAAKTCAIPPANAVPEQAQQSGTEYKIQVVQPKDTGDHMKTDAGVPACK